MIAAIALGVTILGQQPESASPAQQRPPQSLMKQLIPNPTGKNGYEEIVMAADILRSTDYREYDAMARTMPETAEGLTGTRLAVYNDMKGKTMLQRYRKLVERDGKVIDLLYQAAKKDIYDPRTSGDFNTLFPELTVFKDIAKFVAVDSYCLFADGQGAQGTRLLMTALEVFDRLGRGVLIQYLVGVACQSILLPSIEERMPQMSQKDAALMDQAVQEILARQPAIRESISTEFKFTLSGLDKAFGDVKSASELIGMFDDSARESVGPVLSSMGPADLQRIKEGSKSRVAEAGRDMVRLFEGAENQWASYKALDAPTPDWKSTAGIISGVADAILPVFEQAGRSAAVSRTRFRILGLAGSVIKSRWENGQLPNRLSDAVGEDRAMDPLSLLPFELKRDGIGGFSIISKGTKETGEIGIRYKAPKGTGAPEPP